MILPFACFALFLAVAANAQTRPTRAFWEPIGDRVGITDTGVLIVPSLLQELSTGIQVPGDVHVRPGSEILVCGSSSGVGLLERWRKDGSAYAFVDSFSLSNRDFTGVAYNEATDSLYLMDAVNQEILTFSWDGLALFPTSTTLWASQSQLPELSNAGSLRLDSLSDGTLALEEVPGRNRGVAIIGTPPNHTLAKLSYGVAGVAPSSFLIDWKTVSEAGTSMTVMGQRLAPFEIVDQASLQVMGAGIVPTNATTTVVNLTSPLVIGRHYAARLLGQAVQANTGTMCPRRYGFPETLSSGIALRRIPHPTDAFVGNAEFNVRVGLRHSDSAPPPDIIPPEEAPVEGFIGIAFRGADLVDPVVDFEGNSLLVASIVTPAAGAAIAGEGSFSGDIPIPNDPLLQGLVLFVQLYVTDGAVLRRSEVLGFVISPAPNTSQSLTSPPARQLAAQRWFESLVVGGRAVRASTIMPSLMQRMRR